MTARGHIQLLPDHVANKIAAGEVVDRPSSVVKELVENAIDAGATQITVDVTAGGRKSIVISDNGSGMNRDDALLSIERHATSKIRDADDIERVGTLGFRGEALAAISAVSLFTLSTREADSLSGTEVSMSGGKLQDVKDVGCPPGTSIAVRQLFLNVPARRRFLRSEQTELAHVRQVFLVYALAHPEIGFRLIADGREAYLLAGGATLEDRLRELFGPEQVQSLRPVQHKAAGVRVSGYAGLPHIARADRAEQYVFINRRPASAPLINYALNEAYHTLLPRGRHPVVYLFIEMNPEQVDVNVHPAKKEVRFRKPGDVRDTIIAAVRGALESPAQAAGPGAAVGAEPPTPPRAMTETLLAIEDMPRMRVFSYPKMPLAPSEPVRRTDSGIPPSPAAEPAKSGGSPWSWCRVLGQVGGLYVLLETEDGLVLMDPHAAHERVLYEQFMRQVLDHHVTAQGLLSPETVELRPEDALRVRENLERLRGMGFGISEFGGDSFLVDALPVCLGLSSAGSLLVAVAVSLSRSGARGGTEHWAEEQIAQAACKAAVKARDRLTLSEIEGLVVALAGCDMPYTCPHGRPTVIFMSFDELHKKFGRV